VAQREDWKGPGIAATSAAAAMIAQQVAAKSTRDTLFLSHFDVSRWPTMLAWASIVSIVIAFAGARAMTRLGPGRVMPAACTVSAALMLGIAWLSASDASLAAVLLFLHVAAIGPVLISGFWSVFNERFDPRTARQAIGRIGGFGTLGGLAGGLLANEVAKGAGVVAMLPVLAGMHFVCAIALRSLARDAQAPALAGEQVPLLAGVSYLVKRPYLRSLGLLMLLATASAVMLDYVFRRYATAAYSGDSLMRVFSGFHTAVALLAFLVQISLTRLTLDRVRVGETVATLPVAVAASSLMVLAIPGLVSSAIARGLEMVLSNSLFRFGYELLYTPVAPHEKRSTKAIIDVAVGRVGDAIGGGITLLVLALVARHQNGVLLTASTLLAVLALLVARQLSRGYVRTLASNLRSDAPALESQGPLEMSQTLDVTMLPISIQRLAEEHRSAVASDDSRRGPGTSLEDSYAGDRTDRGAGAAAHRDVDTIAGVEPPAGDVDPDARERDLRSGEPDRVFRALGAPEPLPSELAVHAISLLADDALAPAVTRALRKAAPRVVDQLVDALHDPERPVEVRRRIPRILIASPTPVAVEALLHGLEDVRFKVRLQCGWALARLREGSPDVPIDRERVLAAVLREVDIERHVWGGRREMERLEDASDSPFVDDYVRERATASLQHVFTLLSIALSEQMLLRLAFNGLHSGDSHRRGTALEYLDCVLPPEIKEALWPFLEERGRPPRGTRTRDEIIADLVSTNESMRISIAELRKMQGGG
jgi:ATP:ADP antiporter, AAA family